MDIGKKILFHLKNYLQNRWVPINNDGKNCKHEHDSQFAKVDAIISRIA